MPRKPRYLLPGEPQHLIIRGVNRSPIFLMDADYRYYLGRLKEAVEKHACALHAYVLMTNHVHLLMSPSDNTGIPKCIQMLGRYYVQYFNHTHDRTGTLWDGRYKSTLIDTDEYLLTCYRYIEMNPVRARMVANPSDYPWSSYRYNACGQPNPVIRPHDNYIALGRDEGERQQRYRALFTYQIADDQLQAIRSATNKEWVLGRTCYQEKISQQLMRRVKPLRKGGDRKSDSYTKGREINRH